MFSSVHNRRRQPIGNRLGGALPLLMALLVAGTAATASADSARLPGVAGRVKGESSPIAAAGVYAYQLADLSLHKVLTDPQGNFLFSDLPAGLYKIIAHKAGFAPVVVLLTRTTAQAYQFLELQLTESAGADGADTKGAGDDFWAIRARIPADVLRDIESAEAAASTTFTLSPSGALAQLRPAGFQAADLAQFHTEMQAMTGVDGIAAASESQVSVGRVGIEGKVGEMQVGVTGRFWQLATGSQAASLPGGSGQASALSVDLQSGPGSHLNVTGLSNRLGVRGGEGGFGPADFEHYRVSWSQALGENGHSDFAAQYTSESNYSRQGPFDPIDIPENARTWRVEGSYTTNLGSSSTLQTGIRYRERQYGLTGTGPQALQTLQSVPGQGNLDVFGSGGYRLQPAVLVEYGLYNTLSDGSLEVKPRGGVVLQLGNSWQLDSSVSKRVYDRAGVADNDFLPSLYQESDLCEEASKSCYEVHLSHSAGNANSVSVGAVHRTIGKTLRLYFSDDFFDRLESLYLVPGDQLPELRLSASRRLTPKIVTTLQSSLATGGGGIFFASDGRPYQNRVQYLITSLDTKFQSTATGVFIAFHHLNQELDPAGLSHQGVSQVDTERLQVMLTQDLNILFDLASSWAVQLNMELSRGSSPTLSANDTEVRKRFLGGIAVKF